ncbi:MAG: hypothetical protein LQ343_001019 [Gyalolechia ehrenbergii]|nr:MAG: hypothetical protein LQ343_001019 [Gyalolechia ehrenbergii]
MAAPLSAASRIRGSLYGVADQVKKYIRWLEEGYMSSIGKYFDIGNATRNSLCIWRDTFRAVTSGEQWEKGHAAIDKASKKKVQCGNGSLMRVSPMALVYYKGPSKAMEYAALSSRVTHPYPTNAEACKIYTKLIAAAFKDPSKADLASIVANWPFEDPILNSCFEKYTGIELWQKTDAEDISSSGYVVHSLEASLWAFFTTNSFEAGALKAVNLGDDADTVGAIFGGIAGAFYGIEALPESWLDGLEASSTINAVVTGMVALVNSA